MHHTAVNQRTMIVFTNWLRQRVYLTHAFVLTLKKHVKTKCSAGQLTAESDLSTLTRRRPTRRIIASSIRGTLRQSVPFVGVSFSLAFAAAYASAPVAGSAGAVLVRLLAVRAKPINTQSKMT